MPQMSNNNPSSFGWASYGGPSAAHIVPYSWTDPNGVTHDFPSDIADILVPQANYLLSHIWPMIDGGFDTHDYGNGLTGNYGYENRQERLVNVRSFHSYGTALDVNAVQNGEGAHYGTGHLRVPAEAGAFAETLGWLCGGSFSSGTTDPMHFECHNTPDEVLAWNASHSPAPATPAPTNPGGFLMSLSDDQQAEIYSMLKTLTDPATGVVKNTATIRGNTQPFVSGQDTFAHSLAVMLTAVAKAVGANVPPTV